MDEFEHNLKGIEALFEDPTVNEIIDKARRANEQVALYPAGAEEARHIIEDLNDAWAKAGLKGDTIRYTGKAWSINAPLKYVPDTEVSQDYYIEAINQKISVAGFSLFESTQLTEDGIDTAQEIYLNGVTLIDDDSGVGKKSHIDVIASLDPKEGTLHYKGISGRRAEAWLDLYYSDIKQMIAEGCLDAEDDAKRVMRLRNLAVSTEGLGKSAIKELKSNLESYLNYMLKLERHVPYLLSTDGTIKIFGFDNEGVRRYVDNQRPHLQEFATVHGIVCNTTDDMLLEPQLQADLIQDDKKTLTICRIPFTSIQDIQSLRTIASRYKSDN